MQGYARRRLYTIYRNPAASDSGVYMRSIAAHYRFDSLSIDRLLRKEYIERLSFGAKIFLTVGCIAIVVWYARGMVSEVLRTSIDVKQLQQSIDARAAAAVSETAVGQQRNLPFGKIAKAEIFGKIGVPEAVSPVVRTAPVSTVSLKLIGTFVTDGENGTAIIEDSKKPGSQDVFGLNESVFGEAKLTAVFADKVEIEREGKREILMLDDTPSAGGSAAASGEGTVVVDETELDNALANLPLLLTQARAVPYFKDGKSIGLRLFAIRHGSLFEKIGLQNGDILKEINGSSLGDITQAVKLFEKLKEQRDISVTLERQRQDQTFRYLIR